MSFPRHPTLSWSWSTERKWRECKRKVALPLLLGWGGWKRYADEDSRLVYRLSKLTPFLAVVGQIVHKWIGRVLEERGCEDEDRQLDIVTAAIQELRDAWRWSHNNEKEWRLTPKRAPRFFETHYGVEIPDDRAKAGAKRIEDSLRFFFRHVQAAVLAENIVSVEKLIKFDFEGTKVFAMADLVTENGEKTIWDWKTGKPHKGDEQQLGLYGMATGAAAANLVYLEGLGVKASAITEGHLAGARETIRRTVAEPEWRELELAAEKTDRTALFPISEARTKPGVCFGCVFFERCWGTRDMESVRERVMERC